MHPVSRLTLSAAIVALSGLAACGDKVVVDGGGVGPVGKDSTVRSVTVTPQSATVTGTGSINFVASVSGGPDLTNFGVDWSSSNTAVATVDANGVAKGVTPGTVSIIAKSKANPAIQGAATLTVLATAPASLSFFQVQNQFGNPATLNNAAGQLNIVANVDPGQSGLTQVQLNAVCPKTTGTGNDTLVVNTANVQGSTGSQTGQQVTIPFNTAAFNAQTGQVTYLNRTCTLFIRGLTATGGTVITAQGPSVTLNNPDFVSGTITTPNTASDNAGLLWNGGTVTVTATPVFYSGQQPASMSITVSGTDTETGAVAVTKAATASGNVYTATFPVGGAGNIPASWTVPNLTATIAGVTTAGQPIVVASNFVNTPASVALGTPIPQTIRYDNEAPVAPIVNANVFNSQYTGPTGFFGSNTSFTSAAVTNRAGAGGVDIDRNGVDVVTYSYEYTTSSDAAIAGGTATWNAFTSINDIPETATANNYALRVVACDKLGNCARVPVRDVATNTIVQRFGVDVTAPTAARAGGVANLAVFNIGDALPANLSLGVTDPQSTGGVTGSGFNLTAPIRLQITKVVPSGATGQTTVCVYGTGASCAAANYGSTLIDLNAIAGANTPPGEYTVNAFSIDLAGNRSGTVTTKYYIDQQAPTLSGGIAIPGTIAQGTNFQFGLADDMDIAAANGYLAYDNGVRFFQTGTASPTGVTFDSALVRSATGSVSLNPFYTRLQTAIGGAQSIANQFGGRGIDAAGNLSISTPVALPALNIANSTPFTAANLSAFSLAAANADASSAPAATLSAVVTLDNTLTNVTTTPFTQVCFYLQSPSGTEGGDAGFMGAAMNEWVLLGCTSGAVGTTDAANNRFFTYTSSVTRPVGTYNIAAVGQKADGAALMTTNTLTVVP